MEFTYDDLRSSYVAVDQLADKDVTIPDILAQFGLKFEDVLYIAEQRGLRAALIATGEQERLLDLVNRDHPAATYLTPEQQQIQTICAACEMEAIAATLQMVRSSG